MRTHRLFSLALLILFSATYVFGVDEVSKDFTFTDSAPGSKVQISGTFPDEGVRSVLIGLPGKPDGESIRVAAEVSSGKNVLSFDVPKNLAPGRYIVKIKLETAAAVPVGTAVAPGTPALVPAGTTVVPVGELRVTAPETSKVRVDTVEPVRYYPDAQDRYSFQIAGSNFSDVPENNYVEVNKVPLQLVRCPDEPERSANAADAAAPTSNPTKPEPKPCMRSEQGARTRLLIVESFDASEYSKPLLVALRVGDSQNISEQFPITFSRFSKRNLRLLATGAFLALMLIVYLLIRTGVRTGKIEGRFASVRALLLDKDTNSYSLSKFQLLLFTLVSVFGYIYVFVCRMLVQWAFELPDVPQGLPGLMAVSLGTTVVATGVAANVGAKGAGPESPSFSDFISSGGIVLPERFQFFLWTIVASVGVLVLVLASDPVTLQKLPSLPDGMLYLIGLSSAGYLGGKLVRGPGPSIKSVDVGTVPPDAKPPAKATPQTPPTGRDAGDPIGLEITITGSNLSPKATFELDDQRIPADQAEVVCNTPQDQSLKLCSSMTVRLWYVASRYLTGQHLLRVINEDSQAADAKYGATIDSNTLTGDTVTVTGANFKDPSSALWKDAAAGSVEQDLTVAAVTKVSDTQLNVVLTAGATVGEGTLTIKSPKGLTTSVKVNVVEQIAPKPPAVAEEGEVAAAAVTPAAAPAAEESQKEGEQALPQAVTPAAAPEAEVTTEEGGEVESEIPLDSDTPEQTPEAQE
jgi:hypothetical protein